MRKAYSVYIVPADHKVAADVALALVNGDDPLASEAFSQPANVSGDWNDPHTHFYGGMSTNEAWETQVSNMAENVPAGTWPYGGVTEADVIAAAEAIRLQITVTQDSTEPSPQITLDNALSALGLKQAKFQM